MGSIEVLSPPSNYTRLEFNFSFSPLFYFILEGNVMQEF